MTNAGIVDRQFNTDMITDAVEEDGVITITLSGKVSDMKAHDGGGSWGVYKWAGIGIKVGSNTDLTKIKYNGTALTAADEEERETVGLDAGYFVLWVRCDQVIKGLNNQFSLWMDGCKNKKFTLKIVEG